MYMQGQPIGIILADTKFNAIAAAARVKVDYEELPAILTMEHAIAENSFHPGIDVRALFPLSCMSLIRSM